MDSAWLQSIGLGSADFGWSAALEWAVFHWIGSAQLGWTGVG